MNYHSLVTLAKRAVFPNGEPYVFKGRRLRFKAGSRPIRKKYINSKNGVVRNDLLQIEYFEKNFSPGDVLWDIGSHHGHYSIFAAAIVKGKHQVFSFEPDKTARTIQIENLRLNNLSSLVQVKDIAVSNKNGTMKFYFQGGNANSHLITTDYHVPESNIISVESCTIDSLLRELPRPTFVKIDTEGAEIDILSEASSLLIDKKVTFICELHPFAWKMYNSSFDLFLNLIKKYDRDLKLLDGSKQLDDLPFYGTVLF